MDFFRFSEKYNNFFIAQINETCYNFLREAKKYISSKNITAISGRWPIFNDNRQRERNP